MVAMNQSEGVISSKETYDSFNQKIGKFEATKGLKNTEEAFMKMIKRHK
jgi:hypothetical protein